ncbi:ribosome-associated translation inhibitor RaiA [Candidatus Falkowbacteria bacterium]|nr:ribosome-associated translation inhibitor RaiA [Candidatus Falkowbacteria bacterium]
MKYDLKASKIKLTPEIKAYVDKKMQMLDKYLGKLQVIDCNVQIGLVVGGQKSGEIYRTEVVMELPRVLLVIEKHEADLFKSIDKVKDQLARSIVKHHEKVIERRRKS